MQLKGALSYAGMPSFSDALSGDDVRAIRLASFPTK
jgi:hypothetical protein